MRIIATLSTFFSQYEIPALNLSLTGKILFNNIPRTIAIATVPKTIYDDKKNEKIETKTTKSIPGRICLRFKKISFNYEVLPHFKFAGTAISNLLGYGLCIFFSLSIKSSFEIWSATFGLNFLSWAIVDELKPL